MTYYGTLRLAEAPLLPGPLRLYGIQQCRRRVPRVALTSRDRVDERFEGPGRSSGDERLAVERSAREGDQLAGGLRSTLLGRVDGGGDVRVMPVDGIDEFGDAFAGARDGLEDRRLP